MDVTMRKLIAIIFVFSAVLSSQVQADSLKSGIGACVSEDLYKQFINAAIKKDENAWNYLLKNGCVITAAGISVTVLDSTWTGLSKVRAYVDDQAVTLWTDRENVIR